MFAAVLEVSGITCDHEWKLEGDTVVNHGMIQDSVATGLDMKTIFGMTVPCVPSIRTSDGDSD